MSFAASQAAFASALLDADLPIPANITTVLRVQDAARFSVYRNNVLSGLIRALAQMFPVTERLVGTKFFVAMAHSFVLGNKPASPLLMDYGGHFPDFVATFAPAASLPYLADVARIEAARIGAHHAADAAPLLPTDLAGFASHALPGLNLVPHPSARLLRSRFPAGSIWAAHQEAEVAPVTTASAETVLVLRPTLSVCVHILPPQDAAFAAALLSGQPLGIAAEQALQQRPEFDFGSALLGLVGLGAFCAPGHDMGENS